jgi:hypothetical protein
MSLLDSAENLLGPIAPSVRARLLGFISNPDERHWDDVYAIVLRPGKTGYTRTVWQLVMKEDPSFQASRSLGEGWRRIPDAMTVARAIKRHLSQS